MPNLTVAAMAPVGAGFTQLQVGFVNPNFQAQNISVAYAPSVVN